MILRGSCRVLSLAARVNEPAKFLAQVDFLTPMFFRISAAAELAVFVRTNTALDSFAVPCCRFAPRGYLNAQAPLAKIDIRCEIYQVHSQYLCVI